MTGGLQITIFNEDNYPTYKTGIVNGCNTCFQTSWNSIESSAMFINDESLKTFAFYMNTLVSTTGNTVAGQGMAAAASLIMFLPNLILFIILQSRVMDTMMYSGLK